MQPGGHFSRCVEWAEGRSRHPCPSLITDRDQRPARTAKRWQPQAYQAHLPQRPNRAPAQRPADCCGGVFDDGRTHAGTRGRGRQTEAVVDDEDVPPADLTMIGGPHRRGRARVEIGFNDRSAASLSGFRDSRFSPDGYDHAAPRPDVKDVPHCGPRLAQVRKPPDRIAAQQPAQRRRSGSTVGCRHRSVQRWWRCQSDPEQRAQSLPSSVGRASLRNLQAEASRSMNSA